MQRAANVCYPSGRECELMIEDGFCLWEQDLAASTEYSPFTCTVCEIEINYDYHGRQPPYARNVSYVLRALLFISCLMLSGIVMRRNSDGLVQQCSVLFGSKDSLSLSFYPCRCISSHIFLFISVFYDAHILLTSQAIIRHTNFATMMTISDLNILTRW
jgi:hypothetical protein